MNNNYFDSMFNIPKEDIDRHSLARELRVSSQKGFRGSTLVQDCFELNKKRTHWRVPIAYAIKKGFTGEDRTPNIKKTWPKSSLKYRHNQKEVVEKTINHIKDNLCSRIIAETGFGKSVVALDIAKKLKTNALIVVPTNEILKQFESTAKDIFKVDHGVIKGKKEETDKTIVLTTYQTLSRRIKDDNADYLDKFGLLIIDEAHLCGCDSFKTILHNVNSKYKLSVSADFYRSDKLEGVYELHLGQVAAVGKKSKEQTMEKILYAPRAGRYVYMHDCKDRFGDFNQVKYLNLLAESKEYNKYLEGLIHNILDKGERRILVALKRISQAEILSDLLGAELCGLFLGNMKDDQLEISAKKKVILYTKSDLGFDMSKFIGKEEEKLLDPLNTVIVAYPTKNSLQVTGRIARENRGKVGLIVHPVLQDFYSNSAYNKCYLKVYEDLWEEKNFNKIP